MTLAVQTVRQLFSGNGSTTTFAIPFAFSANDEVEVILVDTSDDENAQTYTTHYTISGTNVEMVTAPASGEKLLIKFDPDLEQQIADFNDQVPFVPTTAEASLDDIVKQIQFLNERINRCIIMEKSSASTNVEVERTLTANAALVVNAAADGVEMGPSTTEIANAQTYSLNAATSAASASSSASSASSSATAAASSATAAAASATAAAASAASVGGFQMENGSGTADSISGSGSVAFTAGITKVGVYVVGNGGAVSSVTIQSGTIDGQHILVIGTDDTNTVSIELTNGAAVLGDGDTLEAVWDDDGSRWIEICRSA